MLHPRRKIINESLGFFECLMRGLVQRNERIVTLLDFRLPKRSLYIYMELSHTTQLKLDKINKR